MILRIYRCAVVAGREAEFRAFAYGKSHPWLRNQPGLIAFYAGRPMPGSDGRHRCMVQIWRDLSAIEAAFGENWRDPPKLPDETRQFIDSASVEYYEVADEFQAGGTA